MRLPPKSTFEDLHWLLGLNLNDRNQCRSTRAVMVAEHYQNDDPWRSIKDGNASREAILRCLQNELRVEALKRSEKQSKQLQAQEKAAQAKAQALKNALKDQILQGTSLDDYARCLCAWTTGDESEMQEAAAEIERKRAEWRAKCERDAKAAKQARRKRDAKVLRHRAPRLVINVNWFEDMPVFNHRAHNDAAPWGYCQATGQDRWKVGDFLRENNQKPVDKVRRAGAGKPLVLYGFQTNLLVLDKWLGDWLPNSSHSHWRHGDTERPGEVFWVPGPERVCETIYWAVCSSVHEKHTNAEAALFRAVLRKHWRNAWKDSAGENLRARFKRVGMSAILAPGAGAWRKFRAKKKVQWAEITAKSRAERRPVNCPKPHTEVWNAYERLRELLG